MSRLSSKRWSFAVPALVIGAAMLAMSGACSQHDPGPYEGGGRSTTVPFPNSTSTPDSGSPDNFVAPDVFTAPDSPSG